MSNLYSRDKLADGISFTSVVDSKFKTNTIRIKIMTKLNSETASANALALGIIASANSEYTSQTELAAKMNSLYGGSLFADVGKTGDIQVLTLGASVINNKYTFDGEDITGEMLDIIECCLFRPDVHDGSFNEKEFRHRKQDLLDSIDTEINNKRGYAILRAQQTIFRDEPSAYSSYGTRETAEKLTPQNVYSAYCELLKTAAVEIYYVSDEENNELKERFRKSFAGIERSFCDVQLKNPSPVKEKSERVTDRLDVNQMKMVMAYKTDYEDIYPIIVMNTILGSSPVSKLFANVREKMSLCYYCASAFAASKNTLMIDSGIEKENFEKAEKAINEQFEEIKRGNFTDDEINNAVLSILNSIKGVGDTPSSYISWYFKCLCRGEIIEPDEEAERIKSVTRQQIIDCANSFRADTVYIMTGIEEE
ncbi:MAG: EF-P 5-aminopentanol modification-associated protein YfmF [Oscillospiraceae bacterium]